MAINSHVLSYVQQHSRQYQASAPQKLAFTSSTDKKPRLKRDNLLSTFPFNQCSNPILKETKNSCSDGIADALFHLSDLWAYEGFRQRSPLGDFDDYCKSVDFDSVNSSKTSLISPQIHAETTNSILVKSPNCPNSQRLIKLVSDIFMSLLKRKAGITPNGHVDEVIDESVTYGTNIFLQRFSSPNTLALCQDLIAAKESGELGELLKFVLEEIIYRYELIAFDRFQDAIVDTVVGDYDGKQDPGNPKFYKLFKEIWRLSPGSFFGLSLSDVLSYRADKCESQYSGQEDTIILKFEETAFNMNVTAFYYAMRREFSKELPLKTELTQRDLTELEILLEAAVTYHLRTIENTKIEAPKPKSKTLRFVDL